MSFMSETGVRYGVSPELWERWWIAIPQADRDGFRFQGGDVMLAKFVCALDYLTHRSSAVRAPRINTLIHAYSAAYSADPSSHLTRVRAAEKYEHPAAQFLLDQFEYRNMRATAARLEPAWSELGAQMLETALLPDTPISAKATVYRAIAQSYQMISRENMADRIIRSKTAVKNAEKLVFEGGETETSISNAQLASHVGSLLQTFGKEQIEEAIALADREPERTVPETVDMLKDE